jgi:hypothetical protein
VDFNDYGWLADIANKRAVRDGRTAIPHGDLDRLVARGLVQRSGPLVSLTRRGEIALEKLG